MSRSYFDASALVKLFLQETGSDEAAALWDGAEIVLTSQVADPEVQAALAAAHRSHRLDAESHRRAKRDWGQHRAALRIVDLDAELASRAGELAEQHALGALDAIHLASAVLFADTPLIMATWDARLLRAAQSLRIPTLPAS